MMKNKKKWKVHIVCHHLRDFLTYTGQTLRKVNDHIVEVAHHKVKKFFEARSNYNHKKTKRLYIICLV